jgi:hypothetical protein
MNKGQEKSCTRSLNFVSKICATRIRNFKKFPAVITSDPAKREEGRKWDGERERGGNGVGKKGLRDKLSRPTFSVVPTPMIPTAGISTPLYDVNTFEIETATNRNTLSLVFWKDMLTHRTRSVFVSVQ